MALAAAIVVVALVVLAGNSSYTLNVDFQNASGLVTGDNVLIGPGVVGTVSSIGLTETGAARVKLTLKGGVGPLHQGTVARIYEDSLSGIANKYVELEPGPPDAPKIATGGLIGEQDTHSEVNLDELFDTLDPLTRTGLKGADPRRGGIAEGPGPRRQPGAGVPRAGPAEHQQRDRRARPATSRRSTAWSSRAPRRCRRWPRGAHS